MEIPLEEEEEEVEAKPEMPEKRVPYSMHIVTQLPQHKHLHEESNARKFIEDKLVGAFENFEDLIRHVEAAWLQACQDLGISGAWFYASLCAIFWVFFCTQDSASHWSCSSEPLHRCICRCPHTSTVRSARTRCRRPR